MPMHTDFVKVCHGIKYKYARIFMNKIECLHMELDPAFLRFSAKDQIISLKTWSNYIF